MKNKRQVFFNDIFSTRLLLLEEERIQKNRRGFQLKKKKRNLKTQGVVVVVRWRNETKRT